MKGGRYWSVEVYISPGSAGGLPVRIEEIADRPREGMADFQNRRLARRTDPEMAVSQKEIDAVRFARDRILGGGMDYLHVFDRQFVTTRSALIPADRPAHRQGGFLGKMTGGFEVVCIGGFDDALTQSGTVTQEEEEDAPSRTAAVKPAAQAHLAVFVAGQFAYGDMFEVHERKDSRPCRGLPQECY